MTKSQPIKGKSSNFKKQHKSKPLSKTKFNKNKKKKQT